MCRTFSFKVKSGMDTAVRVMSTLRRKQFDVREFYMKENGLESVFNVTLEDSPKGVEFEKALLHMGKLADVYDIREVC